MIWSELESERILREQTDILLRKELRGVADRSIITDTNTRLYIVTDIEIQYKRSKNDKYNRTNNSVNNFD